MPSQVQLRSAVHSRTPCWNSLASQQTTWPPKAETFIVVLCFGLHTFSYYCRNKWSVVADRRMHACVLSTWSWIYVDAVHAFWQGQHVVHERRLPTAVQTCYWVRNNIICSSFSTESQRISIVTNDNSDRKCTPYTPPLVEVGQATRLSVRLVGPIPSAVMGTL
jgi:hypothetical protein